MRQSIRLLGALLIVCFLWIVVKLSIAQNKDFEQKQWQSQAVPNSYKIPKELKHCKLYEIQNEKTGNFYPVMDCTN
jgi:hypothetical protein